jgi:hypothetical protein
MTELIKQFITFNSNTNFQAEAYDSKKEKKQKSRQ